MRALLLKDNWAQMATVVDVQTFEMAESKRLYAIIGHLHDEVAGDLTKDAVRDAITGQFHLNLAMSERLRQEFDQVAHTELEDGEALLITISNSVKRRKSLEAANYVSTHIDDVDYDASVPIALFQEAAELTGLLTADVTDYRTAPAPGVDDRKGVLGLGFAKEIDDALGGGLAIGEIIVYLAASGNGKTSHMCYTGASWAKEGSNVLHISCEDHENKVRGRYDSCLTGLDKVGLVANPDLVMEKRMALKGNIYIQDWSSRNVYPSDIRSLVMRMAKQGKPIDSLVLDYLGKMLPDSKVADKSTFYGQIEAEVRRIGNELGFRTVTGWQAKREGFLKEFLSQEDIAKDIQVYNECDGMLAINMTPEQRKAKIAIHALLKSRDGMYRPAKRHHVDMDCMRFYPSTQQTEAAE